MNVYYLVVFHIKYIFWTVATGLYLNHSQICFVTERSLYWAHTHTNTYRQHHGRVAKLFHFRCRQKLLNPSSWQLNPLQKPFNLKTRFQAMQNPPNNKLRFPKGLIASSIWNDTNTFTPKRASSSQPVSWAISWAFRSKTTIDKSRQIICAQCFNWKFFPRFAGSLLE